MVSLATPASGAEAPHAFVAAAPMSLVDATSGRGAAPAAQYRFAFVGRTSEYFRIWLVSLALSVLSAGVYSAWGKVRKKRYLYGNTLLCGSGFDFRASPWAVLRGRIVALLLFGGLVLAGGVAVELQLAFAALLVLLAPWIVVACARFHARNTFYRNVAFDFDAPVRTAAKVLLCYGAIAAVTAGLAYPWFRARRARFMVAGHRFGTTRLTCDVAVGPLALVYLLALLAALLLGAGTLASMTGRANADAPAYARLALVLPLVYAGCVAIFAFVRARSLQLVANATKVGIIEVRSALSARRLVALYLGNAVAVIATLGLATPWAVIRVARYRAETLSLLAIEPIDSLAAAPVRTAAAAGSEVSHLFDVDVAL